MVYFRRGLSMVSVKDQEFRVIFLAKDSIHFQKEAISYHFSYQCRTVFSSTVHTGTALYR